MKAFIDLLITFFSKTKPTKIEIANPEPVDRELIMHAPIVVPQRGTFAWIIGHNERAQGAINYLGETEFKFNSRIGEKAHEKLSEKGFRSILIFRPPVRSYRKQTIEVANACEAQDVKFAMLMHFNSFGQKAKGCEFLVINTKENEDNAMADLATDLLNERLNIKERAEDGVRTINEHHNGYGMLKALYDKGVLSTLAEPVFANFKTLESRAIFENEDAYVDILVEVAVQCCSGSLKGQLH